MLVSEDSHLDFKLDAACITLRTKDNEDAGNLAEGYTKQRGQSLSEREKRVNLEAEWESDEETERFLDDMMFWDRLRETLPPLTDKEPMVLAIDAATGRANEPSDCLAFVGVTRHPIRHDEAAVRYVRVWQEKAGRKISFTGNETSPKGTLQRLIEDYNVITVVYDESEMRFMVQEMIQEGVAARWKPFPQGTGTIGRPGRGISDKQLLDAIIQKNIWHDGNPILRQHIDNADRKMDGQDRKIRIVKRLNSKKVDCVVALSMAYVEAMRLRI